MISIFIKAAKLRGIKLRQKPVSLINFQHGNRTRGKHREKRENEKGRKEKRKTHFHTHSWMRFVPRQIFNCWKMPLSMGNYLVIKLSPVFPATEPGSGLPACLPFLGGGQVQDSILTVPWWFSIRHSIYCKATFISSHQRNIYVYRVRKIDRERERDLF